MENILILGFGISGKSAYQAFRSKYKLYLYDENISPDQIADDLTLVESIEDIQGLDIKLAVKSPGIKPSNDFIRGLKKNNIEVISDLELAYRLYPGRTIIAITGTNGKTTTTSLVGHIIAKSPRSVHIIGNIGKGILEAFENGGKDDVYLIEVSSFQLEDTKDFRPKIGAILNLSPDHLDWHGSIENYYSAKAKIYANMTEEDTLIVNGKDKDLEDAREKADYLFSIDPIGENNFYINDGKIVGPDGPIMDSSEIMLVGRHNLENVLAAVAICYSLGLDKEAIKKGVSDFKGVSHRLEFVRSLGGVSYYNDSKGTNVDSTLRALESFDRGIILIAGGYDKKVSFDELFKAAKTRVKAMVLMGQTKDLLKGLADQAGIEAYLVENMAQAVDKSKSLAQPGDTVLLSPASASWGMYKNFEERGDEFKDLVMDLVE